MSGNQKRSVEKTIRKRTILGVFMALVLLVASYLIFIPRQDLAVTAESYLEPYPNLVAPIQKDVGGNPSTYDAAFQLYEMGYYDKAEDQFSLLDQDDEAVQFYMAVNSLLDDETDLAIERLDIIANDEKHRYHNVAQWYCGLAYLSNRERRKAVDMVESVAESESELAEKAQQLIDELRP